MISIGISIRKTHWSYESRKQDKLVLLGKGEGRKVFLKDMMLAQKVKRVLMA